MTEGHVMYGAATTPAPVIQHKSTKTYGHEIGLSCAFRQWRANSHCHFIHGYALKFRFEFEASDLDENNWVMDFGALKPLKATLEYWFDHTLVVAQDDPSLHALTALGDVSLAQIRVMPAVGCEKFAEFAWHLANKFLISNGFSDRVNVTLVEVSEHGANSAIYMSRVNP